MTEARIIRMYEWVQHICFFFSLALRQSNTYVTREIISVYRRDLYIPGQTTKWNDILIIANSIFKWMIEIKIKKRSFTSKHGWWPPLLPAKSGQLHTGSHVIGNWMNHQIKCIFEWTVHHIRPCSHCVRAQVIHIDIWNEMNAGKL